jgi:hypothetical protein
MLGNLKELIVSKVSRQSRYITTVYAQVVVGPWFSSKRTLSGSVTKVKRRRQTDGAGSIFEVAGETFRWIVFNKQLMAEKGLVRVGTSFDLI